jgi:hypothetical protein
MKIQERNGEALHKKLSALVEQNDNRRHLQNAHRVRLKDEELLALEITPFFGH